MGIKVEFKTGPWNEVRSALEKGEVDALPLVSYSREREKVFDFTTPHTVSYAAIFKRKVSPGISSHKDLQGKSVISMESDATHDWLVKNKATKNIVLTKTVPETLRLLASGQHDYALAPRLVGLLTAKESRLRNIETTGPLIEAYGRGYGFAVKEGNFTLLAKLNQGLAIIKETGEYDVIYEKWFGIVDPRKLSNEELVKFALWASLSVLGLIGLSVGWSIALRARVNERTRELQNQIAEREKAEREAEIANRAKSDFLAAMSHDLRTPLNAIMGFAEIMKLRTFGKLGDPHYEKYAEDIYDSGNLLVSLINDILDLSKIEAGKYELQENSLEISSLIQTSFRQLGKMAEISKQTLRSDIPSDIHNLRGDERAMIQILNNLISNAIKFTPVGGEIDVRVSLCPNNGIIICVIDTGMGMSEEGIAKALQPFEQTDGTHSRRHQGTGLGLHLCVNLMKLFDGKLEIESDIDKGTEVTLRFPPKRSLNPQKSFATEPIAL